jgi:RAT1-interacting protein
MQYYYPPQPSQLPLDLSAGFETFQKLDDVPDEHLDALLDTIVALEQNTEKKCEADIVTWRGMMTKVCTLSTVEVLGGWLMISWTDNDGAF